MMCEYAADIRVERRFKPLEPECPWLWITFTAGMFPLMETEMTLELFPGMVVPHGTPIGGRSA